MRSGDLERWFHGTRSTARPSDAETVKGAVSLACAAYSPLLTSRQFFSHTTAALLWGCPLPRGLETPLPIHVSTFAPGRAVRREGVIGHQVDHAVTRIRRGYRVVGPVDLFCQLASILALDDLVAVADHLVLDPAVLDPYDLRPHVLLPALMERVEAFSGRGCRRARVAVRLARAGAESRRETLLRLLLVRAGFPEPEVNPELYSDAGRWLGRADLVYRQWKVIVEYDGDQHRTDTVQYEKDIARIEKLERAGWIVIRVRARGLAAGRADTIGRVEHALLSRGWRH